MILYNVTVKIETAIHQDWLQWMKNVHIPEVMQTGIFTENRICRILGEDEKEGVTYAVQYLCPDLTAFQRYQQEFAARLQADHRERYHDRYVAFRTLMEVI